MKKKETIWFFNEDVNFTLRDKGILRRWLREIIRKERFRTGEINIIFCSDEHLLEINVNYLNHNTLTDIITFDLSDDVGTLKGDIYISLDRARENAKSYGVALITELRRLMAHGILHLSGYTDKNQKDKQLMTSKEDYYLSLPAK